MITFGPVPSRRLGNSLGINNIPPKTCSYACVYCQLGRTSSMRIARRPFYEPREIFRDVKSMLDRVVDAGNTADYLAFVPDGEPTLDSNLGRTIDLLRPLGIDIAVITNSSLIWREDVRADLMKTDWVCFKLDSCDDTIWRAINRPHGSLTLDAIKDGLQGFAGAYRGILAVEVMLIGGVNDEPEAIGGIASFLADIQPARVYLSVPIRPPAERWVARPDAASLNRAFQILNRSLSGVECLTRYEGNQFAHTGRIEEELLRITAVHPMREEAVRALLQRAGTDWSVMQALIEAGRIVETEYEGRKFYLRLFD